MKRIVWVLYSSFFALSVQAQPLTLNALRTQMQGKGTTWQAGETKMSTMSVEDQKRLLGAPMPDHADYFFTPQSMRTQGNYASSHDWRSSNGRNYASPILDQGRCGSCVAFAAIGQLETQMNIARGTSSTPYEFSPQHLFSCGGGGCETGWTPFSALNFLESDGVPDEACFPYESGAVGTDMACSRTCSDSKSRSMKIARSYMAAFFFSSVDSLKSAIKKGPLLATMTVYEDFMYYKGGVYKYTGGTALGGHAVVIEGWSDADKAWIVRNSWGEDFGEKGYFRVAWNDKSGVGNQAWGIEVGSADGFVTFQNLRDRAVFSGKAQALHVESTYADTQRVRWQVLNGPTVMAENSVTRSSTTTLDTTPIADGKYTIVAIAERANGPVRGQPRDIYILNGKLTGTIALTSHQAGAVLTGKQVLAFNLTYAPIPFTQLIFRAKNPATGEEITRSTPHVASTINLSFETRKLGNGDWDLSLEGLADTQSVLSPTVRVAIKN
ncbi:C1 family peptidase [bacterium]|nr:C1 family peptidase [bacterium]